PEQARSAKRVGPAADVYALGAILYECLTGRPPFRGATTAETLRQLLERDPVPVRQLQPAVPRDLETVCLTCLRKEPERRYGSAPALADALRRLLDGRPILARPAGRLERGWRWARRYKALAGLYAVSALAAVALLSLGFWFTARVGEARGDAAAASARQQAAEEVAASERYLSLVTGARERALAGRAGWTWAGLDDLAAAAPLPPARNRLPELRSALAECLGAVDVRPSATLAKDFVSDCCALHPRGRR